MSKADREESKSKHDLTNLFKQWDKLRQAAIPDANPLSSQTAGSVLQALLTIEFPTKIVADQKFIDAIVLGSKSLNCRDACFKDFCELICKVFSKQTKPSALKQSACTSIVTFLLDTFNATTDAETRVDILRALSIILYDNIHNNSKHFEELVPLLIQVADKSRRPLEIRRMAINCLGNICCNAGTKLQNYYSAIFEVIMSNISTVEHTSQGTTMIVARSLDFNDQALRRVASSTLRSLHLILYEDKSILSNKLVDIVDIIRTFVFYNINSTTYKYAKEDGYVTTVNSMQLLPHQQRMSHLRQQEQTKRLSANFSPLSNISINRDYGAISSDSEISDSEAINPGSRRHRDNAKIRINALLCLQAIAKTSPKSFYQYWENFIPHNFDPFVYYNKMKGTNESLSDRSLASYLLHVEHSQSLFTILLFDPTPTLRLAVSNVLMGMLDGSKQYLSVAVARDAKSTSFTSLSEKVAAISRDLHNGLWCALELETNATITLQLFKLLRSTGNGICTKDLQQVNTIHRPFR
ncbi:hypothetical protein BGW37DRAFT_302964 [Umbelopsis sp. PMI_123]|nr:hypothetical protein BGW37DRAFT_302964 [Umbelopsis sp. PMI_123]